MKPLVLTFSLALLGLPAQSQQPAPVRPPLTGREFSLTEAQAHDLGHKTFLRLPNAEGWNQVQLQVQVSPNGFVTDARAGNALDPFGPAAEAFARTWRYRPFLLHGQPVTAIVIGYVNVYPPERRPTGHAAFPDLHDIPFTLTFSRSGCYGTCPGYSVSVDQTGLVHFHGGSFVVVPGDHTATLSRDDLHALVAAFEQADFFSLDDVYHANVTDNPTYGLAVTSARGNKKVMDYVGESAGMPQAVTDLEKTFDRLAGTARWISAGPGLAESLAAERFDFASPEAAKYLVAAAEQNHPESVSALLKYGVVPVSDPNHALLDAAARSGNPTILATIFAQRGFHADTNDLEGALATAAGRNDTAMMRTLLSHGADPNLTPPKVSAPTHPVSVFTPQPRLTFVPALNTAASNCSPDAVQLLLAYHADVNRKDGNGDSAIVLVGDLYGVSGADCVDVIHLLAQGGADLNAALPDGTTALHRVGDPAIALALLTAGADPNRRNAKGETPLFTVYSDDIIAILLAHGADPRLTNNAGQTPLQAAAASKVFIYSERRIQMLRDALQQAHQPTDAPLGH